MKNKTIRLRKKIINEIFPDEFTKMRREDFVTKAVNNKNILNKREFDALVNQKSDVSLDYEFFAKKHKNKIELVKFDD
jgi:hypothetical protein